MDPGGSDVAPDFRSDGVGLAYESDYRGVWGVFFPKD